MAPRRPYLGNITAWLLLSRRASRRRTFKKTNFKKTNIKTTERGSKLTTAYINRIATGVPAHDVHELFLGVARVLLGDNEYAQDRFDRMSQMSGISAVLPPGTPEGPVSVTRNQLLSRKMPAQSLEAPNRFPAETAALNSTAQAKSWVCPAASIRLAGLPQGVDESMDFVVDPPRDRPIAWSPPFWAPAVLMSTRNGGVDHRVFFVGRSPTVGKCDDDPAFHPSAETQMHALRIADAHRGAALWGARAGLL
jgi:hypothetical protein